MEERITDALARKAEPAEAGLRFIWGALAKGFALRVTARGAKSFVLNYRARGRQCRITIGGCPEWSVAAAREAAEDMKREVDLGGDPMGERQLYKALPR
jgi:hypothetical protein